MLLLVYTWQMFNFPDLTADDIKKAAREFGADIVGIGSIERWKDVPEPENPKAIMPRAKSVICIAFRIHRGVMRGAEEGTYFSAYTLSGFDDINQVIAPTVQRKLANFIEDHGFEAAPVMYYAKNLGMNTGEAAQRPDGTLKPKPEISFNFRTGGVLCGIGEVGHSRNLLTKKFGPSQRVYFIITEAELDEDPIINGICDRCMECVKICPAKALHHKANDSIEIPNVTTIRRSSLDVIKCRLAHIAGGLSPYAPEEVKRYVKNIVDGTAECAADGSPRPAPEEIDEYVTSKVSYAANAQKLFHSPSGLCGTGCIRACLAHLSAKDTLSLKFRHQF